VVLYDACVLYPAPLRDLLIRVGKAGLVRARWSQTILDECFHAIHRERPEVPEAALSRTRRLMCAAVRDCLVEGFEPLMAGLSLPDPNDRHVLAAAIRAGAQTIVTRNLKDFPQDRLSPFGIVAQDPDDFLLGLLNLQGSAVLRILTEQAADLRNPPRTVEDLLVTLESNGLTRSVADLSALLRGT
jgi:hypothetical protein